MHDKSSAESPVAANESKEPVKAAAPKPGDAADSVAAAAGDSDTFNLPDKRPPVALRLLIEHLWLLAAPVYLGLFLLIIYFTNPIDLTFLPMPRAMQAALAALALLTLGVGPYYLFRRTIDWTRQDLLLHRDAEMASKDAKRRMQRYGGRLEAEVRGRIEATLKELDDSLAEGPPRRVNDALIKLDQVLGDHLQFGKKGAPREYGESIGVAVLIALLLRAFVVEAFKIPSGSMIPTLQVGDHIFVSKFLYGVRLPWTDIKLFKHVREPRRGEIIVFVYPIDPDKDFIKRIVGIPGDTVQVCGGQVIINNQPVRREALPGPCEYDDSDEEHSSGIWHRVQCVAYREWNGNESYVTVHNSMTAGLSQSCTTPYTVPAEQVFVMGDNRDNSHDSRFWGTVRYDLIKGKAWFIWWSAGERTSVRLGRMFNRIHQ